MKKTFFTTAIIASLTLGALSAPVLAGPEDIVIEDAWSRASIGTDRPGAAYMTIRNAGEETVLLIGLETPLAMMPEIHESKTNADGVSSMSPAGEITIAPGESVLLEPGGLHAMLMRLKEPMVEGQTFELKLLFENSDDVTVEVPILSIASRGPES
ncbi:copper chaperone PCu(A)C [Roseovarius nanhaiticus]|uniref:copper chaperone PCu(A)C n=1 Tax=Roseovarius nanhaiticus TaxID=573024 RepID=UPI00248F5847|nr:copper chaperone PCu(A)C [Roseovarius nanhaiticus]